MTGVKLFPCLLSTREVETELRNSQHFDFLIDAPSLAQPRTRALQNPLTPRETLGSPEPFLGESTRNLLPVDTQAAPGRGHEP